MLKYLLPLVVVPVLSFAQPAAAQQPYWWQAANPDAPGGAYNDDQSVDTDGPYGPDPYAARADRFNEDQYRAYRREMWRRYHRTDYGNPPPSDYSTGDDQQNVPYAAPIYPVQPKAKVAQSKPVVKKKPATTAPASAAASTATPTVAAAPATATASAAPTTAATTTTASTSPAPAKAPKGAPVSCDKGASIVSSFGFEKVTNKTCEGASLVYSAERGGKPFEIEVNPKSGELTAVKKL